MRGGLKYIVEMGSGTVIYVPSFLKSGSSIQKLMVEDTQQDGFISLLLFFKNKESRLKMEKEVFAPLIQN
jgi:hypothetical protein